MELTNKGLRPSEIVDRLDEVVIGQIEAKRALALAAFRQWNRAVRLAAGERPEDVFPKQNILMIGPTGAGKTLLVQTLASILDVPFSAADATRLEPPGQGGGIKDIVSGLIRNCAADKDALEMGVIFIDEIDKLRAAEGSDQPSVGVAMQQAMLTLLEGTQVPVVLDGAMRNLDTRNILFVVAGAFPGLDEIIADRLGVGESGLGFRATTTDCHLDDYRLRLSASREDFERFGMISEFVARFPVKTALHSLSKEDLSHILTASARSPYALAMKEFAWHGVRLVVEDAAVAAIVDEAHRRRTGGRAVAEVFERVISQAAFELPGLAERGIGKATITAETVTKGMPPVLHACKPLRRAPLPREVSQHKQEDAEVLRLFPPGALPRRPARTATGAQGSARWATECDLKRWLEPPKGRKWATSFPGSTILVEEAGDSTTLRPLLDRTIYLDDDTRRRHVLFVGKTGSGKTTRCILPVLASDIQDPNRSVIVIDAQLELTPKVIAMTRKFRGPNAKIIYINLTDPQHTVSWNPLQDVKTRGTAAAIATAIGNCIPSDAHESPYFRMQAIRMLTELIRGVVATNDPELANMGAIHDAVERGAPVLLRLAERIESLELKEFASHVAEGNSNYVTSYAELQNLLISWNDEAVCASTSRDELRFDQLDQEPTVLIYAMPEESVRRLRPATNCFVQSLLEFVMKRREDSVVAPISLVIDEFASAVGRLEDLATRVSTLRKRGLCLTAAVQHTSQILCEYGELGANMLKGFTSVFFIPPVDEDDAKLASQKSHLTTVQQIHTTDGVTPASVTSETRYVLSPGDVNPLERHPRLGPRISIFLADTYAFQAFLRPAYDVPEWKDVFARHGISSDLPERPQPLTWEQGRIGRLAEGEVAGPGRLPPGMTETRGWTDDQIRTKLEEVKTRICWTKTEGSARKWWQAFEDENLHRLALVLRLAEELLNRKATITEFFLAYVYSNTDNIMANLHYLDYTRLKKQEERRKRGEPTDEEPNRDCQK